MVLLYIPPMVPQREKGYFFSWNFFFGRDGGWMGCGGPAPGLNWTIGLLDCGLVLQSLILLFFYACSPFFPSDLAVASIFFKYLFYVPDV